MDIHRHLHESDMFPSLDAKLATALNILPGNMLRTINSMKEHMTLDGKLMKGRQYFFDIYQKYRIAETEGSISWIFATSCR